MPQALSLKLKLEPLPSPKIPHHTQSDTQHNDQKQWIGPRKIKFRHIFEIHSIQASNKGQRDKNRSYNSKHFHNLIHPIIDARKINIQRTGNNIPKSLDTIDNLNRMIIDIPQIRTQSFIDKRGFESLQRANHFSQRPNRLAKIDKIVLELLDFW